MTTRTLARVWLPKPLVITLGNLKGGATKTTTSFFLACYFALTHGLKVLVIDADPLSQTGYSWFLRLQEGGIEVPFDVIAFPSKFVGREIAKHRGDYDVIIVDAGGESDEIFKAAVRETNLLLLMTATSPSEYNRLPATYEAALEAAAKVDQEILVRVLLTKVPVVNRKNEDGEMTNKSIEYRKARHFLEDADYQVCEHFVSAAQWYRLAADSEVGEGADNPIIDLGEYRQVGDEIIGWYQKEVA